jgi:tripeptidyl-peptidase-2
MLTTTSFYFRIERKFGVFSKLDACTFVANIYNNGNVLSVVTDCSPHATHVAGIAAAFHPTVLIYNLICALKFI